MLSNGNVYKGEFKDGKRHGEGTFMFKGEWKDDEFHGSISFDVMKGVRHIMEKTHRCLFCNYQG